MKEERDKLGEIIAQRFWKEENQIACLFQALSSLKEAVVFRDITAYHILSYKYRTDNGVYSVENMCEDTEEVKRPPKMSSKRLNVFLILKKVERLFFSLTLQLPLSRKCSKQAASTAGSIVLSIAQVTSLVWCDEKAKTIFRVVRFFSGPRMAEHLERTHVKDAELETLVLSRIPYVTNLTLDQDCRFKLKDSPHPPIDLSIYLLLKKVSHIDHFIAENYTRLETIRERIVEFYQDARDLTFRNNMVLTKSHIPDFSTIRNGGLAGRFHECVSCLTHLLRLMSYGNNVKQLESDERFKKFVEGLKVTVDQLATTVTENMVNIEQSRKNIVVCLNDLTTEHVLADREFIKAKLELIEKDLKSHVKYLHTKKTKGGLSPPLKPPTTLSSTSQATTSKQQPTFITIPKAPRSQKARHKHKTKTPSQTTTATTTTASTTATTKTDATAFMDEKRDTRMSSSVEEPSPGSESLLLPQPHKKRKKKRPPSPEAGRLLPCAVSMEVSEAQDNDEEPFYETPV